jgi:Flp pilus assembly protein TadG
MKRRILKRFFHDDRGNLSVMFALTLLPVVGLIGMSVDFTMSSKRKAILDAIVDSASLAAVTPAMLSQGDSASITAATNLFNSQVGSVPGIGTTILSVTASDIGLSRTVTVSYNTTSTALFSKLVGKTTIPIGGTSQSTASVPPTGLPLKQRQRPLDQPQRFLDDVGDEPILAQAFDRAVGA